MIINAENLILGRVASVAAKKALLGEDVTIVNCEKAVMTGNRQEIFARYKKKREIGQVYHGPYIMRMPDKFIKRTVRGMLPYKQEKGRKALERVKCYVGVPEKMKNEKMETIEKANVSKVPSLRYITISDICKSMGAK